MGFPYTAAKQSQKIELQSLNMDRAEALNQIIIFGEFRDTAFKELVKFGLAFDSDAETIEVSNQILAGVLAMFIADTITLDDLEEWASFVESRDDINYSTIEGYVYALANPELMGGVDKNKIAKMLQLLMAA
ncbi:MAG: hypothetical protein V7784_03055 [Oceanospirillaceae bacterium]